MICPAGNTNPDYVMSLGLQGIPCRVGGAGLQAASAAGIEQHFGQEMGGALLLLPGS